MDSQRLAKVAKGYPSLVSALSDDSPVGGWTHTFYRYPARFSPAFAAAAIDTFTEPGDVVLDPFCGGGTTMVEALLRGRPAVGSDISNLASFIATVKLTALTEADRRRIREWATELKPRLNLRGDALVYGDDEPIAWSSLGSREVWRIRKVVNLALQWLHLLPALRQRNFARCAILRTAQWALDGRRRIPNVETFRSRLFEHLTQMLDAMTGFGAALSAQRASYRSSTPLRSWCITADAAQIPKAALWRKVPRPKLILTSPPYPGVHVLYHRWQILGRRETSAPFWIADQLDGHGPSHYTFAGRTNQSQYFRRTTETFRSLAALSDADTVLVQLVGFATPSAHVQPYLDAIADAGFEEIMPLGERTWRKVPNRKWHADQKGETGGSNEVMLVHRLRRAAT